MSSSTLPLSPAARRRELSAPALLERARSPEALVGALTLAFFAAAAAIGADSRWAAALGRVVIEEGGIPSGVPFAAAPSADWANVPVLGELLLGVAWAGGHGVHVLHLAAIGATLALLAADMRRTGTTSTGRALALLLTAAGAASALLVIRLQSASIVLFALTLLLLRAEARSPSRRIWLLVPLFALWSNLHGAALVGLAVAGAYLLLDRARRSPLTAAAVLALSGAAICATPALHRTPSYYAGVLGSEVAGQKEGLWAPLSLTSPLDLLLILCALALVGLALRARPALWELVALAGLAVMTAQASRNGVWLVLAAAVPAARSLRLSRTLPRRWQLAPVLWLAALVGVFALQGPATAGVSDGLLARALDAADGTPILATAPAAEQVALAGGRVWIGNPIDAFEPADQRAYLAWLDGGGAVPPGVRILVTDGADDALGASLAGDTRLRLLAEDASGAVYAVRSAGSPEG